MIAFGVQRGYALLFCNEFFFLYAECFPHAINIKKHAIILDLNGLLLTREDPKGSSSNCVHICLDRYKVVIRPGCLEFLEDLCRQFHVGIWSTMLHRNVCSHVNALQQYAKRSYPFFMVWGQEDCYIHGLRKVYRPDKPQVEAMFKPLLRVWNQFKTSFNRKNTILLDDSPFKGCINPPSNCIYPYSFQGHADNMLHDELLPYLLKLNQTNDIRSFISLNRLGQDPITKSHELFVRFADIIDEWQSFTSQFLHEELEDYSSTKDVSSCASSHFSRQTKRLEYISKKMEKQEEYSKSKDPFTVAKTFDVPQLSSSQLKLLRVVANTKSLTGEHAIAYAGHLGYDQGGFISGVAAKTYISKLQNAYLNS